MGGCLTPGKKAYPSREAAVVGAYAMKMGHLFPYMCSCGQWHLTSRRNTTDDLPEQLVSLLQTASDAEFASLVRAEVYGKATPQEAAALRTAGLLRRWSRALKEMAAELQRQMEAASHKDDPLTRRWRQKHVQRIQGVVARRREAKELVGEEMRVRRQMAEGEDPRAKAREAGRRAIDRLIDAHRAEFEEYLAEEKALDVDDPDVEHAGG